MLLVTLALLLFQRVWKTLLAMPLQLYARYLGISFSRPYSLIHCCSVAALPSQHQLTDRRTSALSAFSAKIHDVAVQLFDMSDEQAMRRAGIHLEPTIG